jgi:hypothetical protein
MLLRRNLIATAVAAGAATRLDRWPSIGMGDRVSSRYDMLAGLYADLACPPQMGRACLQALPESERAPEYLARTILEDPAPLCSGYASPRGLRYLIREKSRVDFDRGRIVDVEGWILSLTETRVYAFGSLLAKNARHASGRVFD